MIFFTLLIGLCIEVSAHTDAIYGDDNRQDVYAVSSPLLKKMAMTTAALIEKSQVSILGTQAIIRAVSLGNMYKLCPGERFRHQPTAALCSGTLVADDLIMTAAHCYDQPKETCKDYFWVFDYKVDKENQAEVRVPVQNIYECQEIILKERDQSQEIDHALIKLKRPVADRAYANLRKLDAVSVNDPLVLIGHPSGLPTKIAADAFVLTVKNTFFLSNVDAFAINSGSGVFNALSGEVEGILSSGRSDYDGKGNCSSVKKYAMGEGNEKVMRPIRVKKFLETYHR